ncbi:type IV pilus assembly protein PilM [Sanguibacter gelidistatuariae]|uniref:Type IV pilus assembly protein PilM n=1 Tax=Sanguibacter gelidistatuariae TaxID=1814289 RepID=A0A1G6JRH6_9MICO|nr:type IV pilus assembly protein PilM [Sanguibacter gelidistatuariae]SDC21303.1 type IV pilus assembly protein PilM [Sanguibacter gelidistatuariae]
MTKSRIIGLDIGSTHVRAAELKFDPKGLDSQSVPELVRFGQVALPEGALRDGEVAEPNVVATALKQLWREQKFSTKDVAIGVGNQRVLIRDLDLPAMPLDQIRASLPYQVQDLLPVAVEDAVLDYLPTGIYDGQHGSLVGGLLVAATKDTVQANTAAVEAAGLRPVMVDVNAFALTRALSRGQWAERTIAVVDLGARITDVVVIDRGAPRFVRTLPTGGADMTEAIARSMNLSLSDAEQLKRQVGIGKTVPPAYQEAASAIAEVGHVLVEAVRNTLSFYSMNNSGGAIEMVLLTGGGASLPGLGQYLSTAARVSVSLAAPMSGLRLGHAIASQSDESWQQTISLSAGLAMGAAA